MCCCCCKQKTAYEVRISNWSSDVCSSDLYPAQVAGGDDIAHRWSEMVVAPDDRHIAWTTLLANYSAMVFTGELQKEGAAYKIVNAQIVSKIGRATCRERVCQYV